MKRSSSTTWVVGTVVVGLLLAAAGWFLAISPRLSEAASTRDQTASVASSNEVLQTKIATLKKEKAQLATYQSQLADLRRQLPSTAATSDLLRQLQAQAEASGVTVISITPGTPATLTATSPSNSTGTVSSGSSSTTTSDGSTTSAAAAPSAATATAGLVGIPLSIDVVGTYAAAEDFLTAVQGTNDRLFLVSTLTLTSQQASQGGAGRPATQPGDAELVVTGTILALPGSGSGSTNEAASTPTLPSAIPGKNPLVPIG